MKRVLFWPHQPRRVNKAFYALRDLSIEVVDDASKRTTDGGFFWSYRTRTEMPFDQFAFFESLYNKGGVDVSKTRVERVWRRCGGRPVLIDPRRAIGTVVEKSDDQCARDASLKAAPVEPRDGYVYARYIDTRTQRNEYIDLRVALFGDVIPYVVKKYKRGALQEATRIAVTPPQKVFSESEIALILDFARAFDVQYAEFDVLRERATGNIYIVDVNNIAGTAAALDTLSQVDRNLMWSLYLEHFETLIERLARTGSQDA